MDLLAIMPLPKKIYHKISLEYARFEKIFSENNIVCAVFMSLKKILTAISSFMIALIILMIRPFAKIYLVRLNSSRIGHFALSTELMLSEFELNQDALKGKILLYYLRLSAANLQLLKMVNRKLVIVPMPRLCAGIDAWLHRFLGGAYQNDFVKSFESNSALSDSNGGDGGDRNGVFRKTKTHLSFTKDEHDKGAKLSEQLGIPSGAKYACLLVRDNAYMKNEFPGSDHSHHAVRNVDIQTYARAALYLAENGYYVIRMGKHVEKSFSASHPKIIDYANHAVRSDFMDIYLSAHCYFFITTGSGLDSIACMFRRPKLITNIILPENLSVWYPGVYFTYKKIRDKVSNAYLPVKRMIEIGLINPKSGVSDEILYQNNLELIDNTEDEILGAVCDMLAYLDGKQNETHYDILAHEKFSEIFSLVRKSQDIVIKISPSYLRSGQVTLE